MTTHLYLAPAAAGKTAYVLAQARAAAQVTDRHHACHPDPPAGPLHGGLG